MASLLKKLWPWGSEQHSAAVVDNTVYEIHTRTHFYRGVIVTQDDTSLSLRTDNGKAVKVFKDNIQKIVLEKSPGQHK